MEKNLARLSQDIINLKYIESDEIEPLFYAKETFKDDGERIKYIKKVEAIVRNSQEYKDLIKYIRSDLNINHCSVLSNLSSMEVAIEIHHAPFTLFDITETILNYRLENKLIFSTLNLAEEVIILHYEGLVGLTPLSATMHELVHSGKMYVKPAEIIGNVEAFKERYEGYFSESAVDKYINFKNLKEDDFIPKENLLFDDEKSNGLLERINSVNERIDFQTTKGIENASHDS